MDTLPENYAVVAAPRRPAPGHCRPRGNVEEIFTEPEQPPSEAQSQLVVQDEGDRQAPAEARRRAATSPPPRASAQASAEARSQAVTLPSLAPAAGPPAAVLSPAVIPRETSGEKDFDLSEREMADPCSRTAGARPQEVEGEATWRRVQTQVTEMQPACERGEPHVEGKTAVCAMDSSYSDGTLWLDTDDAAAAAIAAGPCGLGYISFLCIGFNSLVNWVFVMQTLPFIADTQLDGEDWNNSLLGIFQGVEVLVLLCMLRLGSTSVLAVCTAGLINAATAIVYPVLTVNSYSSRQVKVVLLHLLCLVLGSCSAVLQGSGFALAAVMPRNYVGAVSAGQGLAGSFCFAVVSLASFVWFEIETIRGTTQLVWLAFSIAAGTSITCTGLFFAAMRQTWAAAALRKVAAREARRKRESDNDDKEHAKKQNGDVGRDADENEAQNSAKTTGATCDDVIVHSGSDKSSAQALLLQASSGASTGLSGACYTQPSEEMRATQAEKRTTGTEESRELLIKQLDSRSLNGPPIPALTAVISTTAPRVAPDAAAAARASEEDEGKDEEMEKRATEHNGRTRRSSRRRRRSRRSVGGWVNQQTPVQTLPPEEPRPPPVKAPSRRHRHKKVTTKAEREQQRQKERQGAGPATEAQLAKPLSRWQVLKLAAPWLFVLMLHMFITFHLFPKVGPLSWNYPHPPVRNHLVILLGIFCVAETIGRFLPDVHILRWPWAARSCDSSKGTPDAASISGRSSSSSGSSSSNCNIFPEDAGDDYSDSSSSSTSGDDTTAIDAGGRNWFMLSRRALVCCEMARMLLFIPFILGYVVRNVSFLNNYFWYCFLITTLALTQGWMGTLAFYYSVTSVESPEARKLTGPLTAIASPLGCVIGLYSAAPY